MSRFDFGDLDACLALTGIEQLHQDGRGNAKWGQNDEGLETPWDFGILFVSGGFKGRIWQ